MSSSPSSSDLSPTTDEATRLATEQVDQFIASFTAIEAEIGKVFVGHADLVRLVLSTLMADGHILIEGVPGLGKTLLVRTLSEVVDLDFARVQFTPDLMPTDLTGTHAIIEKPGGGLELQLEPGPIVTHLLLADEINRATPKTQSALLQAMQERQVSLGKDTIDLPNPFMVLATQNPIEQEGTYPLPEAQLDRFMVKLLVDYPQEGEYATILQRTTGEAMPEIRHVCSGERLLEMRRTVRQVAASDQILSYATRLVMATQPGSRYATDRVNRYVSMGASPRAGQALLLMGKVQALLENRFTLSVHDLRRIALPVLRHRMVLRFEALADGHDVDGLVGEILETVSESTFDA
ncbi:AAA family ATPase [Mucisphaera calidilacus]|nr:MoxR family ATPase [Mucisphaera calidilacus]